ncbi:hypothetical protein SmJEL517_g05102 [Synchytrium microbalum]|uniref:Uncharacterized protein n=1 Tax=Synchytrium microbalum TaxID=1806994 RepID=A0A507BR18_9FUNG|nr:uncharacterized protein SmJEL517_g05102 [Synchytrium microbalum]TPX31607.1 hypothetical protein SmJEL517_g05102 [Synchytrium microbalum]
MNAAMIRGSTRALRGAMLAQVRTKTSLSPPNVASLKELGKLQSSYPQAHPEIFGKMKAFYAAIPKGPAPHTAPTTFGGKYYQKYVEGDTFWPILHFIAAASAFGFVITYHAGGCSAYYNYRNAAGRNSLLNTSFHPLLGSLPPPLRIPLSNSIKCLSLSESVE